MKFHMILASTLLIGMAASVNANTLEEVKHRGLLNCGVSTGLAGFSQTKQNGDWSGLDVDVCRGVAAAVLGDASKVEYKPLAFKDAFSTLQAGDIDLLANTITWTYSRDTAMGMHFAGTIYYDGAGFMVHKASGINSAAELADTAGCIQKGTSTEQAVADYFHEKNMSYTVKLFDTTNQARKAFAANDCDFLASDQSGLYAMRMGLKDPANAVVLPEVISKEPLGPVVREGDDAWFNIVKWVINAWIEGEYQGVTSTNADALRQSGNPGQKRLLGTEGNLGQKLGLSNDWAYQVIKQVGNYSESFERNVGMQSPLKIARGLNAQWNEGGILYSPAMR